MSPVDGWLASDLVKGASRRGRCGWDGNRHLDGAGIAVGRDGDRDNRLAVARVVVLEVGVARTKEIMLARVTAKMGKRVQPRGESLTQGWPYPGRADQGHHASGS